jgi:hypothetical protein
MRCHQDLAAAACAVTNYGNPGGPSDAAIADAVDHSSPGQTVAMEFSPPPAGGRPIVKFYVYDQAGNLTPTAKLDSQGLKVMPYICLVCHGGVYGDSTNPDKGASFREFDVSAFDYDRRPSSPYTQENLQPVFKVLNDIVRNTAPNPDQRDPTKSPPVLGPIVDLINVMSASPDPIKAARDYVPPGWAANPDLYHRVTRPYCRSCHIAQAYDYSWTDFSQWTKRLRQLEAQVCSKHNMPHAQVPFERFWLTLDSPYTPDYLAGQLSAETGDGQHYFSDGCPRAGSSRAIAGPE